MSTPELLAPAGDWDCARAAVENGADAIYFGLERGFNARARATNFSLDNLPDLLHYLHQRGVRGYVTFNTLVFPEEFADAERLIVTLEQHGVDALLVQDVGLAKRARELCPDLPLHASTQMTMTSAETIALAEALDMQRVVLARELSIDEIRDIRSQSSMPLEVFVHGALCVAYSGQCLTSESLGGRSANRGQCAQACRLPYDLLSDGRDIDLGSQKYLLSPQDLAAYDLTTQLIEAGVGAFKIEGRLKTAEYVANITRHYRQAIDDAAEQLPVRMNAQQQYEMEMSFSRGFSPGWLQGCDHKQLVPATSSAKRGVRAGRVIEVRNQQVVVQLDCGLQPGDGVVFAPTGAAARDPQKQQGGRIFHILEGERPQKLAAAGARVSLTFGNDAIDWSHVSAGMQLWKTDDPALNQRLRSTYAVADPARRVALDLTVRCAAGEPLVVGGRADNGATFQVTSSAPLAEAKKHPVDEVVLRDQLGRLGATVFQLRSLDTHVQGRPMVPFSVLGQVRREMIAQLEACDLHPRPRSQPQHVTMESHQSLDLPHTSEQDTLEQDTSEQDTSDVDTSKLDKTCSTQLHLLCRTLGQLQAAAESGISNLYAEFQDIREYRAAVAAAHAQGAQVYLATPRIQKPGELGIFRSLAKHGADGILVRNFAGMQFFAAQEMPIVVDFSLNIANARSAEYFIAQGAERVTASYDLNRDQLVQLVQTTPANWLECVLHQHMPMFHMEHCVFCAALSPGTNKTNCGRPCDIHQVELRDRIGMEHPLTADVGCRNTLYNATPQSSAEIVRSLVRQGVGHFRVELLRESPRDALHTYQLYADLLAGHAEPAEVWRTLQANNRVGVTRGTLEERNPLALL